MEFILEIQSTLLGLRGNRPHISQTSNILKLIFGNPNLLIEPEENVVCLGRSGFTCDILPYDLMLPQLSPLYEDDYGLNLPHSHSFIATEFDDISELTNISVLLTAAVCTESQSKYVG